MELCYAIPATLTLVYIIYRLFSKGAGPDKNAPPSLPSLPIIGSLPFLSGLDTLYLCFMEKAKRYGNVYSLRVGSRYAVVVSGYQNIHEALVKHAAEFAGRGPMYHENEVWNVESRGLIFKQYGEAYKKNRLHSVAVLKQFGFGDRRTMEAKIYREANHLLDYIKAKKGTAFYPVDVFALSTLNVIHDLLFSERFEAGDPTEVYIRSIVHYFVDSANPLYDLFPVILHLPKYKKRIAAMRPVSTKWMEFLGNKIRDSAEKMDGDDNFVMEYIKKVGSEYDEMELKFILRDLIFAGTETTSMLLCFAVILLGNHPDVMRRLQTELDAVVSRERLPSMDDKARLPYMEATILEIMRARSVTPLGAPHYTLCETELAGYSIPANTLVLLNIWSAHMDPAAWNEPSRFKPERFLDETGCVTSRELMISFSLGKRSCIGEILARHELFLFLSALVQQFDILPPEGQTTIRDEMKFVRVLSPAPFQVRFLQRM